MTGSGSASKKARSVETIECTAVEDPSASEKALGECFLALVSLCLRRLVRPERHRHTLPSANSWPVSSASRMCSHSASSPCAMKSCSWECVQAERTSQAGAGSQFVSCVVS